MEDKIQQLIQSIKESWEKANTHFERYNESKDISHLTEMNEQYEQIKSPIREINNLANSLTESNPSLSERLFNFTHDMKGAGTTTIGFIDVLIRKQDEKYLSRITRGHNALKELLDHFGEPFNPKPTDPKEIITSVVSMHDTPMQLKINTLPTQVEVDPYHMKSVIANIVGNAVNNLKENSIENPLIKINAGKENEHFFIDIEDNGTGIEEAVNPLQKGDTSRRELGGTGLGGYIAKKAVEMHNGTISYETTPGKGTTFKIKIPIRRKEI